MWVLWGERGGGVCERVICCCIRLVSFSPHESLRKRNTAQRAEMQSRHNHTTSRPQYVDRRTTHIRPTVLRVWVEERVCCAALCMLHLERDVMGGSKSKRYLIIRPHRQLTRPEARRVHWKGVKPLQGHRQMILRVLQMGEGVRKG